MDFVHTKGAPEAIGPYSQAVVEDGWVYTSGQIGLDPATGKMVGGDFENEARRVFENLRQVLAAAGSDFSKVVKATVFLSDFAQFASLNQIYAEHMGGNRPARSTVEVAALPKGARLEIDLVARR